MITDSPARRAEVIAARRAAPSAFKPRDLERWELKSAALRLVRGPARYVAFNMQLTVDELEYVYDMTPVTAARVFALLHP